ncbi:hypothetical protein [Treponema putidum]
MKQKRLVSVIGALVLITSAVALISGCQQANGNQNNTISDWKPVSNKSDLVGTWKADFSMSGVVGSKMLFVASDFSGYLQHEEDYSSADASYAASVAGAVSELEDIGFDVEHDSANKTISARLNFTPEVLEGMLSFIKLNSSKTKMKFTAGENSVEYTKQ